MNPIAYRTTGLFIKTIATLSKARFKVHGVENIPAGSIIFVINHFTRIETLLLPYHISRLTQIPAWSLASDSLFKGTMSRLLDSVGAISTKNPDRDRLIVKTLLTGEASWIIFPEGRMVKSKKIFDKGLIKTNLRMIKRYTQFFNIGLLLAFINLKWFEIQDLRTIIRGSEAKIDPDIVRKLLVH